MEREKRWVILTQSADALTVSCLYSESRLPKVLFISRSWLQCSAPQY